MQRDEAIAFKVYDSEKDGRARFTPHCSFDDPETPADAPPRQSIDLVPRLDYFPMTHHG